jgi:hypothetical protein
MDATSQDNALPMSDAGAPAPRAGKVARKPSARSSPPRVPDTSSQVSLTLPREILQAYDEISRESGVNRAHLMREALSLYAALLATGQRVYQLPGRRVA